VDRQRVKFLLLGLGVLASMGLLLVVGMNRPGALHYYVTVSEFLAQSGSLRDDFRVDGKVAVGSIERLPSGQDVRFTMAGEDGASMPVHYHGVIPDTFVDDATVVVEGRLQSDGTFLAHTLLAKCPSKYEAAEGAGDTASATGG
jgi:cytochrome c-type biogenesis protein CcmE